ncbi:MAG: N-carbamoyl-D-amino-acid hydrolase [Pseudomonadales bacterium]
MTRNIKVGAAQLGAINLADTREAVVGRMLELMREAAAANCDVVVYPELALTTFFPRYFMEDQKDVDAYFEHEMPNAATQPLFDEAKRLGIGFYLGYAEAEGENRFNTSILVNKKGGITGKYRKIHLPGHDEHRPQSPFQHLEKRYFDIGDKGFPVWREFDSIIGMGICNDRRWPETYRVMALQGAEMLMFGYNTPTQNIYYHEPAHRRMAQHILCVQAGAYQNGAWVVAVAKAGKEDDHGLMGGTVIASPVGEIVALSTSEEDELLIYTCDMDLCRFIKENIFNFEKHRQVEHYGLITSQTGAIEPPNK